MKKQLHHLIILLFASTVYLTGFAQNLVVNPSFENTSACPQGISQFNLAIGWAQGNSGADSCTTSDLYASCTPQIGGSNSPNGLLGYQQSRTGTHHAGIILTEGFLGCTSLGDNYREYIEGQLTSSLVAGQKYLVRFYMSLPEGVMGGTDDFGVYFSNSYYSHNACTGGQLMPVTPQLNYCGPCIMDTLNWVEVRWIYTATGGEQYFTIGNFKNDANTTICQLNCSSFNPYVYYYIDDVEISLAGANDCSFSVVTSSTNTGCNNNNGTATVLAAGCTSPFSYTWSNSASNTTINNLSAATYTVTVSDNTSCSSTASVAVNSYLAPAVQISTINSSCTSNTGTVIANATGTGPFSYHWNTGANTQVVNNLGAGTYTVTVTGAGNCSATSSASITASAGGLNLTTSFTAASCGNNNGTATVNVNSGTGPFTYAWSNSQTSQTISNLAPGTYTVTVSSNTSSTPTPFWTEDFTNASGWTFADGPGTNGAQPNQWVINNNADCACSTGKYLHVTCNSASMVCLGNAGSCTYFAGSPIPNPLFGDPTADKLAISPAISTVGKANIVMKFKYQGVGGTNDFGQVGFSNNGGTTWTFMPTQYRNVMSCSVDSINIPSNYENIANFKIAFRWVNDNDGEGTDPAFAIDDVELVENSSSNCPSVASVTVTGSSSISVTTSTTAANCGQNNGTATATVSGSGNYTYSWNNGGSGATISNLSGGVYTVTVNAGGGCTATASVTVSSSAGLSVTANATNASCGQNNGTATVTVSGTGNYTYVWSGGSGSTATINNLSAGTYTVTVSEGGCTATASATVAASPGLSAAFIVTQPSCGQSNGNLNCTNLYGGTQPISTEWSLNGTVITTNTSISNLGSGTYTFHASDVNGCSLDTSFTLSSTGANSVTINATKTIMCAGDSSVICAPSGYQSYLWNNGATTPCIQAKLAGNYYVTVTDNGNCTATSNHLAINVHQLPPVSISVNGDTLLAYNSISYQWYLNGVAIPGATHPMLIANQAGSYTVVVTDINGCSAQSLPVQITGIIEVTNRDVNVYPNPTTNGWFLNVTSELVGHTVEIFDDNGRLVYNSVIQYNQSELNFDAAQGIYLLRINSNKTSITKKLIKL